MCLSVLSFGSWGIRITLRAWNIDSCSVAMVRMNTGQIKPDKRSNCVKKKLPAVTVDNINVSVSLRRGLDTTKMEAVETGVEWAMWFYRVKHTACRDPQITLSLCDARQYEAVLWNFHPRGRIWKYLVLSPLHGDIRTQISQKIQYKSGPTLSVIHRRYLIAIIE